MSAGYLKRATPKGSRRMTGPMPLSAAPVCGFPKLLRSSPKRAVSASATTSAAVSSCEAIHSCALYSSSNSRISISGSSVTSLSIYCTDPGPDIFSILESRRASTASRASFRQHTFIRSDGPSNGLFPDSAMISLHLSALPWSRKEASISERRLTFSLSITVLPSHPALTRASLQPSISSAVP